MGCLSLKPLASDSSFGMLFLSSAKATSTPRPPPPSKKAPLDM